MFFIISEMKLGILCKYLIQRTCKNVRNYDLRSFVIYVYGNLIPII